MAIDELSFTDHEAISILDTVSLWDKPGLNSEIDMVKHRNFPLGFRYSPLDQVSAAPNNREKQSGTRLGIEIASYHTKVKYSLRS